MERRRKFRRRVGQHSWGRPMDFGELQDNLRQLLWRRIHAGHLSGMRLAREAGLRQPHISNFLNAKRRLSLEALDRVLQVQHLSVLDLLGEEELSRHAAIVPASHDEFENVILVDSDLRALQPRFTREHVSDTLKISKNRLCLLRPALEGDRSAWQRFICLQASAREGMSMYPRLLPAAILLLDRHYNSLAPYRRNEHNMYAVVHNGHCYFRYVEQQSGYLLLHPENRAYVAHAVPLAGKSASDYIAGRICSVQVET